MLAWYKTLFLVFAIHLTTKTIFWYLKISSTTIYTWWCRTHKMHRSWTAHIFRNQGLKRSQWGNQSTFFKQKKNCATIHSNAIKWHIRMASNMALGKKIAQSSSSKFLSSRNLMRFLIGKNSSNQLSRLYIFPLIALKNTHFLWVLHYTKKHFRQIFLNAL